MALLGNPMTPQQQQMYSLLGIDPAQMRRQALFNGLAAAGFTMMGNKDLSKAGNAFLLGTNQGQRDAMQNAMDMYKVQTDAEDRAYGREQDAKNWEWKQKSFEEDARRYGMDYALRKQELDAQNDWNSIARGHQQKQWAMDDQLREGQMNAVNDWTNNFKSQGGNLFSPEMQYGLRQAGISGVDPMDTVKYNQAKPYIMAGDVPNAFNTVASPTSMSGVPSQVNERKAAAAQMGMSPDDPAYKSYVLTGKMPREDQAPLTATDKKAILDADEAVQTNQQTIDLLNAVITPDQSGKSLNDKAGYGATAGWQSWAARNDPTGFFNDQTGQATTEMQNIILNQALGSLKSIFGGNPTEGERSILLDLQASVDKTPAERKPIIERAILAANRRLAFNKQRADALRGGTYYKSGGSPNAAPSVDDLVKQYTTPQQ